MEFFEDRGIRKSQLFPVINRAVGLAGLTKPEVEDRLRLPVAGTIPHGGADFTELLNQAKPFTEVHPNHPVSITARGLVEILESRVSRRRGGTMPLDGAPSGGFGG